MCSSACAVLSCWYCASGRGRSRCRKRAAADLGHRPRRGSYVGPDNGLFTFALEEARRGGLELDRPGVLAAGDQPRPFMAATSSRRSPRIWPTAGGRVRSASPIDDPVRLSAGPRCTAGPGTSPGHVIQVDHFGNLITNIPGHGWPAARWRARSRAGGSPDPQHVCGRPSRASCWLLISSDGHAEMAVRDGSAAGACSTSESAHPSTYTVISA